MALNALVFFYRDVLKRELGDFGDYKKATGKKRIPVVLSVDEIRRILAEMSEEQALTARLQYGSGLRISELMRLRIKDVDFENKQLIVRGGRVKDLVSRDCCERRFIPYEKQSNRASIKWTQRN